MSFQGWIIKEMWTENTVEEIFMAKFQVSCQNFPGGTCVIRSGYAVLKATIFDIRLADLIYICYGTYPC